MNNNAYYLRHGLKGHSNNYFIPHLSGSTPTQMYPPVVTMVKTYVSIIPFINQTNERSDKNHKLT